jgi:hypothetical protein
LQQAAAVGCDSCHSACAGISRFSAISRISVLD